MRRRLDMVFSPKMSRPLHGNEQWLAYKTKVAGRSALRPYGMTIALDKERLRPAPRLRDKGGECLSFLGPVLGNFPSGPEGRGLSRWRSSCLLFCSWKIIR